MALRQWYPKPDCLLDMRAGNQESERQYRSSRHYSVLHQVGNFTQTIQSSAPLKTATSKSVGCYQRCLGLVFPSSSQVCLKLPLTTHVPILDNLILLYTRETFLNTHLHHEVLSMILPPLWLVSPHPWSSTTTTVRS